LWGRRFKRNMGIGAVLCRSAPLVHLYALLYRLEDSN